MSNQPDIVVIDQGELGDVIEVLEELEVDYEHFAKYSLPRPHPQPEKLLVTTAATAGALEYRRSVERVPGRAFWIAIADSDSRSQRRLVLESGFDYLVRRPVHGTALKLLIERALYRGNEHRRGSRVAVGYGITFKAGLRSRAATLVDVSPSGCRLLSRHKVGRGHPVTVYFPRKLTAGTSFSHGGVVARVGPGEAEGGERDEYAIGIRFERFEPEDVKRMRTMLSSLCNGPPTLSGGEGNTNPTLQVLERFKLPRKEAPPVIADAPKDPSDRRLDRRSVYESEVAIFGLDNCVLMGRDLSPHGLRLDAHPALVPGAEIRLSLPTNDGDPVVVGARVVRDDGERGVALNFEWIDDAERLDALVKSLPPIFCITEEDDSTQRVVLTELVPNLLRRKRP